MRKDMSRVMDGITTLSSEQDAAKKRLASLESLSSKLGELQKVEKAAQTSLKDVRTLEAALADLRHQVEAVRTEAGNSSAMIDTKIDTAASQLRKDIAFNTATVSRLDNEGKKATLDLQSLRKDIQTAIRNGTKAQAEEAQLQKRMEDVEKLQAGFREMESGKDALSSAMESQFQERLKFLEAEMKQKAGALETGLEESARAATEKLASDISTVRKDLTEKSRSFDKSVAELRSTMSRELAEVRSLADSAKSDKRDKFDSAIKAFLNSRADINNSMTALAVRLSEMEKRMDAFMRMATRMDLLERKMDRTSEKGNDMRRDVDRLERNTTKGSEKVMFVDLEKGAGEV
jgi:chromosome segregation ATPase